MERARAMSSALRRTEGRISARILKFPFSVALGLCAAFGGLIVLWGVLTLEKGGWGRGQMTQKELSVHQQWIFQTNYRPLQIRVPKLIAQSLGLQRGSGVTITMVMIKRLPKSEPH